MGVGRSVAASERAATTPVVTRRVMPLSRFLAQQHCLASSIAGSGARRSSPRTGVLRMFEHPPSHRIPLVVEPQVPRVLLLGFSGVGWSSTPRFTAYPAAQGSDTCMRD